MKYFIITSRNSGRTHNKDLYELADKLKIKEDDIYFTESSFKWKEIKRLKVDIHFDDVPEECELIAHNTDCMPILIWDIYCKGSVKENSFGSDKF